MTTDIKTKKCACCGLEKPVTEFHKHRRTADGYGNVCKACGAKRKAALGSKSRIEPVYHEELSQFQPRILMEHLSAIGYKGTLQIPRTITL